MMPSRAGHVLAWLLCLATVLLLAAGALVTSTGSSLAVPDWPLAYGQFFPPMVGGILYEHGHRMVATTVGLLTVITAAWLLWSEPRRWVKGLAFGAVAVVIAQGLLGGLTVIYLLPKPISISHAVLAQVFFLMTVALVQVTSPAWPRLIHPQRRLAPGRMGIVCAATFGAVLITLAVGATVRHHGAGLAIPDFPSAYGRVVPPLTSFPIVIHFMHRVSALAVFVLVLGAVGSAVLHFRQVPELLRPAMAMGALTVLQIGLGGWIIWSQRAVPATTIHLVNGALLLAVSGLLALRAIVLVPTPHASRERSAGPAGSPTETSTIQGADER